MAHTLLGAAVVLILAIRGAAAAAPPDQCGFDLADFVLPCFAAYEIGLQPFHRDEIKYMAQLIEDRLSGGDKLDSIGVYGYGVMFKPDDPAVINSELRAEGVRTALLKELRDRGVKVKGKQVVALGLGDPLWPSQGTTQEQRWLMRKVEVYVTYADVKKKGEQGGCTKDEKALERLSGFDQVYSSTGREQAVRCMTGLLKRQYSCKDNNQTKYHHSRASNIAFWTEFVERFERGRKPLGDYACQGKKSDALKNCMGTLDGDVVAGLDVLNRRIAEFGLDAQPRQVRRLAECRIARRIIDDFENEPMSVYSCYPRQVRALLACKATAP